MKSLRCRSSRDMLCAVAIFSLLSIYVTYRLGAPVVDKSSASGSPLWLTSQPEHDLLRRGILSQLSLRDKLADDPRRRKIPSRLEKLLLQLEERWLPSPGPRGKVALVRGQKGIINRDLPTYRRALLKHGFAVKTPSSTRNHYLNERNGTLVYSADDDFPIGRDEVHPEDWHLLLCMSFTDGDSGNCLEKTAYAHLQNHQKVNRIPGIRNSLWRKDGFCVMMGTARQLPSARRSHLTPLCFVLPNQMEQLLHVADALGDDARWIVKPMSPGGSMELVDSSESFGILRLKEYSKQRPILIQQYFPHPLLVFGSPVSLRVYVLVTSISPLRAFMFSEGLVHFRHDHTKGFRKMVNRTWLLSQLWHYIASSYGQHAVKTALLNLQSALVQTLLIAETMITAHLAMIPGNENKYRCQHCFQLLGIDLIFNSTFHPVILEVNGQPNLQETPRDDGWAANGVKRSLLDSVFGLLFENSSIAQDVADALEDSADSIGIMGLNCLISHDLCLSEEDLISLMDTRRENVNKGGFRPLYPALGMERFSSLIRDLEYLSLSPRSLNLPQKSSTKREASRHVTADLHILLNSLERSYNRKVFEDDYTDSGLENAALWSGLNLSFVLRPHDGAADKSSTQDLLSRPPCSEDPVTMPYLLNIYSEPSLNLTPTFTPLTVEYTTKVPYEQLLVTVWAFSQNCQSEARLDDKFGPSQPANYTLGLGDNKLTFLIVDIRHTEPWVINSYNLIIHRASPTDDESPFAFSQPHEICGLKQECELRLVPGDPCGLQRESSRNWTDVVTSKAALPLCQRGDAGGRWILPCTSCSDRNSCFWHEAMWSPYDCQHEHVLQPALAECLAGKKLLFIGDSTNRGIMHYLMERLNGTLAEWDKTHHIRVYDNLNSGRTSISFAYYPQFWLPTNERPVFDKALFRLLQRSRPLENNSNTVLVVGGVHWLATQHLHMMLQALRRDGLQGIRLVMKTLGSGFHLPVDGVHCLSQAEQRKLLLHSRGLADFARHYYFDVIDTFNITIPRFRDFLQGKCACHFHRVVPVTTDPSGREFRYHVEGPVNAAYSEILISRLCGRWKEFS